MKALLKLAVGAAIAYALVNVLRKQQWGRLDPAFGEPARGEAANDAATDSATVEGGYTPTELVADSSSVGEGSGDQRVKLN